MSKQSETNYQKKIKQLLDERGCYHEVIWGGGFQASGIPDILGVYRGIYLGLELKVGNNKPSPLQLAKVKLIRRSGGIGAILWDNIEPLEQILDSIDEFWNEGTEFRTDRYTIKGDSYD